MGMANIWEKAISVLVGNFNLGLTYLITNVFEMEKKTENEQLILTQFAMTSEKI